jgi:hypothetical protein
MIATTSPGRGPGSSLSFLVGTWVGSFGSLVHDEPIDGQAPPPQLAGYLRNGSRFDQTAGYFPAATLICLRFKNDGTLVGRVQINRGGRKHKLNPDPATGTGPVTGGFGVEWNDQLQIIEGEFFTIYHPPAAHPDFPDIKIEYHYAASDHNELEWVWWSSTMPPDGELFRASVGHGTLRRVLYRRPDDFSTVHEDPV